MDSEVEIAIVGTGCRFPGADNLDEFWKVLINGENHVKDIPESRWNNSAFYDEDQLAPGKIYVKKAGLLKNHDKWDNRLFGISEVEATRVDPQQRYVLECVHMALEDGGLTRKQINGSNTGVIIGSMNDDYKVMANSDLSEVGGYNATGTASSVLAARVSYVYNLHGTCLTLDTACSSALIAIHLASQSIKSGDCEMMICGGVSSILSPDTFKALCEARMLSAIGQCQSFCDTADGYARGEGCGIVILKSLKAAVEDGNKIWATIKTGSNQDGSAAKPMTAPSSDQQVELLKHVYQTHRFSPSDIQYIEAHGTGTPRGDPTEINALGKFFSSSRSTQSSPLLFGSVKSNIGHTESAAGIAGLIKVLLMLKHGKYVPSLHVKPDKSNINKSIKLSEYNLDVITSEQDFPPNKCGERYACLNSFGFGGSNTHAIITRKIDVSTSQKQMNQTCSLTPICISAVDHASLKQNLFQFKDDVNDEIDSQLDIAYTSFNHRDIFQFRTLVFGHDMKQIQEECNHRIERIPDILPTKKHNTVFVFCGVGTTWNGMCQELMRENAVFSKTIDQIDMYLKPLTGWRMRDKFLADTNYEDPFLNHVAIFCVQVALTEVWKSFGIAPDAIVGQSVGEVAAAYAANLLTLEEAVKIIYVRSEILARQTGGSMTVVGNMDIKEVENICSEYQDKVCIAVYSSPVACTISGSTKELSELMDSLKEKEKNKSTFIRELKVKCAYHSPLLEDCIGEIKTKIDDFLHKSTEIRKIDNETKIPMISTVSGMPATSHQMKTGSYWATNIRQPVRFMQSIKQTFDENSYNVYLEIGPRPVLRAHLSNIIQESSKACTMPSMLPKQELKCLYRSLSEMFELGIDFDISKLIDDKQCQLATFPRYVFNRTSELVIPKSSREYLAGYTINNSHMFVKTAKRENDMNFEILVDSKSTPFVYDHFLSEKIIVPGATYIETGFQIGMELFKKPVDRLSVSFNFAKTFSPSIGRQNMIRVKINSQSATDVHFSVVNVESVLANGTVSERSIPMRLPVDINCLRVECTMFKTKAECYMSLEKFNFRYGPSLSLIQRAWLSESEPKCLTEICIPEHFCEELTKTHFHPAIIDSVFQIFGILIEENTLTNAFVVPKGVGAVVVNKPVEHVMYGYGEEIDATETSRHYNAVLLSSNGTVIAEFQNFYTAIITSETDLQDKSYTYALNWYEVEDNSISEQVICPYDVILFSDSKRSDLISELRKQANVLPKTGNGGILIPQYESYENMIVVYHISGVDNSCQEYAMQDVFDHAVQRFIELKRLLTALKDLNYRLPIAVITENTQNCPSRQSINYNGSELWGMLRSAALEGGIKNMKLIDIDRENLDIKILIKLLSRSETSEIEYALSGTILYQPKLQTEHSQRKSIRPVAFTDTEKLAICSTAENEIKSPHLLMSSKVAAQKNTLPVFVDALTNHSKELYSKTLRNITMDDKLLQKQEDESFHVVSIEGRGKLKETGYDVLFLYPIKAETIVDIPRECIVKCIDCPIESNGILILTSLLIQIAATLPDGTDVLVVKQSDEVDFGQELFMEIMFKKKCSTVFLTTRQLDHEEEYADIQTLVITTYLSVKRWKELVRSFPHVNKIISLNIFFPENFSFWLKHTNPDLQLTVLSTLDMLAVNQTKDTMQRVKECLRRFQPDTAVKNTSHFLLDLPMDSLPIKEKMDDGSLECFCNSTSLFRSQACYVIVGGLTGLGWVLLQLMAESGAGVLITLSRRVPSNIVQDELDKLQKMYDCRIVTLQTDISDLHSVKRTFSNINKMFPNFPIKGIFHGAGILADSVLDNLDEQKIKNVMEPKIRGTWNLHHATLNLPLDYFVLHSSIVSVIGNPGQCNYAAANSFMDSFALYRRSKGLPAQSINWGALAVGMAVDNDSIKLQLKRSGFSALSQTQIKTFFLEAMVNDVTSVVYADVEWEKLLSQQSMSSSAKYSEFQSKMGSVTHTSNTEYFDTDELVNMETDEQIETIQNVLRQLIHEQMVIEDNVLTSDKSISSLGIDSMAAMSLSNTIDEVFKCRIPLVVLLSDETTLSTIAETIRLNLGSQSSKQELQDSEKHFDSQIARLFTTNGFTFMQLDFLEQYKHRRNDPYYLRVIDVELSNLKFTIDDLHKILRHVLKINPELRKTFYFSDTNDVSFELVPEDSLDIDIARMPDVTLEDREAADIRLQLPADLHGRLPVSFKFSETDTSTILRVITHALVMDMRGLSLLCMDIEATIKAYFYKTDMPVRPMIDVPDVVKSYILPRMKDLEQYWKTYLDCDIRPVTLGQGPSLQVVDDKDCSISLVGIPQETVLAIKDYLTKAGITLYEFIMSLYQIYLYIGSNCPIITVGTAADMRLHVPGLKGSITRCVNYLPIIAYIDNTRTISEFMTENRKSLSTTTQYGAYPNSLILQKLNTTETRENVFRHFLAMNDMGEINKVMEEKDSRASIRHIWHMRHNRETFIFVRYDLQKNWIKLEIGQNTKICGPYGKSFANIMMRLADAVMEKSNKVIESLRDEMSYNQNVIGSHGIIENTNMDGTKGNYQSYPTPHNKTLSKNTWKEKFVTQIEVSSQPGKQEIIGKVPTSENIFPRKDVKGGYSQSAVTGIAKESHFMQIMDEERFPVANIRIKNNLPVERAKVKGENQEGLNETHKLESKSVPKMLEKKSPIILKTGQFDKQTSHGWDHKVEVRLCVTDGRVMLEWGKEKRMRKNKPKVFDLTASREVIMRDLNGLKTLIFVGNEKMLVLKTPNIQRARDWLGTIQSVLSEV